MTRAWFLALALVVLLLAVHRPAHALSGTVTLVTDGDTLWIRLDAGSGGAPKPRAFRLNGIDAPEICQPWGREAQAALEARVLRRRVLLHDTATDDYRRGVATLALDGEDIGAWMVAQGHAWNVTFRHHPGPYAAQQHAARVARRGLFAQTDALEPRRFRKAHGSCRGR